MTPQERRAAQDAIARLLVNLAALLADSDPLDNPWHLEELAGDARRLSEKIRVAIAATL